MLLVPKVQIVYSHYRKWKYAKKSRDNKGYIKKKNPLQQSPNGNPCPRGSTGLEQASLPALTIQGEVSYGAH